MSVRALAKTALHRSRPLTVKISFLETYRDALRHNPMLANDEEVFMLVARTARDEHLNTVAREAALEVIGAFLQRRPDWADSTVAQAVMKKRYFGFEQDAFDLLKAKRRDLVEQEWQRRQEIRETERRSKTEPAVPARHRARSPRAAMAEPS